MKSAAEQLALLSRGVSQIEPLAELKQKLERSVATGKPLRVKYGIDPTGVDVHLGHTVPLRKLRLFQELGHQAVLILGTATAQVGDPSGRDQHRVGLTPEQIEQNARDYLTQIGKIVDTSKAEVRPNGDWFRAFDFARLLRLLSQVSMQRMLERDDFTKRREAGVPIYLHECLYPLMQGHDSVEIRADVELGGNDQLFNLMMGRDLQRDAGQEPQICITMPILRGLDGVRRMGKSLNNYVGVAEPALEMFGKTMSIPDALLPEWYELLTDYTIAEIAERCDPTRTKPMDAKKQLGVAIAAFYHGADAATAARAEWEARFSGGADPSEIEEVALPASDLVDGGLTIVKLLLALGMVKSGNEAKQLLGPKSGVTIGPERTKITEPTAVIAVTDGLVVRVGSRRIKRVRLT